MEKKNNKKQHNWHPKLFLEFLGRSVITLFSLYLMREVFQERLNYNWLFLVGGLILMVWVFIPFYEIEKEDNKE